MANHMNLILSIIFNKFVYFLVVNIGIESEMEAAP